jgi:hypothetical protein
MNNNPITTLPYVADELRNKGSLYYPNSKAYSIDIISDSNPNQDAFRNNWQREAMQEALTRVNTTQISKLNLLKERHYPMKGTNKGQEAFFGARDLKENKFMNDRFTGGADITYSSRESPEERNRNRKDILNRLSDSYGTIQANQRGTAGAMANNAKKQFVERELPIQGLNLTSIQERVISGLIDGNVFRDLFAVIGFFANSIAYINNLGFFNNLLAILRDMLQRTDFIYQERLRNEESYKDSNYADAFKTALQRLILFIEKNKEVYGRDIGSRIMVQDATARALLSPKPPNEQDAFDRELEGGPAIDDNIEDEYGDDVAPDELLPGMGGEEGGEEVPVLPTVFEMIEAPVESTAQIEEIFRLQPDAVIRQWAKDNIQHNFRATSSRFAMAHTIAAKIKSQTGRVFNFLPLPQA